MTSPSYVPCLWHEVMRLLHCPRQQVNWRIHVTCQPWSARSKIIPNSSPNNPNTIHQSDIQVYPSGTSRPWCEKHRGLTHLGPGLSSLCQVPYLGSSFGMCGRKKLHLHENSALEEFSMWTQNVSCIWHDSVLFEIYLSKYTSIILWYSMCITLSIYLSLYIYICIYIYMYTHTH